MSKPNTKEILNRALRIIGENGMGGISAKATSITDAVRVLGMNTDETPPSRLLDEFRRQALVTVTQLKGQVHFALTVKGIHRLQKAQLSSLTITRPERWDNRWRMVTYDAPATFRKQRYELVVELRRLGFFMIKESTWVHPYPCYDVLSELVRYCSMQRYVTIAEIVRFDPVTAGKLARHYTDLPQ